MNQVSRCRRRNATLTSNKVEYPTTTSTSTSTSLRTSQSPHNSSLTKPTTTTATTTHESSDDTDTEEDKHSDDEGSNSSEQHQQHNHDHDQHDQQQEGVAKVRKRDRILRCRCLRTGSTSSHLCCGHQIGCDFICHRRRYRYNWRIALLSIIITLLASSISYFYLFLRSSQKPPLPLPPTTTPFVIINATVIFTSRTHDSNMDKQPLSCTNSYYHLQFSVADQIRRTVPQCGCQLTWLNGTTNHTDLPPHLHPDHPDNPHRAHHHHHHNHHNHHHHHAHHRHLSLDHLRHLERHHFDFQFDIPSFEPDVFIMLRRHRPRPITIGRVHAAIADYRIGQSLTQSWLFMFEDMNVTLVISAVFHSGYHSAYLACSSSPSLNTSCGLCVVDGVM
jgi:hypothetical protein